MTVPDAAPTAEDLIAEVAAGHYACGVDMTTPRQYTARGGWNVTCTCGKPVGESGDDDIEERHARHVSAAVVAAIRGMSVGQLHDLRPDLTVEVALFGVGGGHWRTADDAEDEQHLRRMCEQSGGEMRARVVGPWQVTP